MVGLSEEDIEELYSLRQLMEAEAISLCVARETGDHPEVSRALAQMEAAAQVGDSEAFAEADLDFHTSFYEASGHRRLAALWQQYRPTFATMLSLTNAEDRDLRPVFQDHVDLLDRVRSSDRDTALHLIHDHIDGSRHRLLAAYTRSRGGENAVGEVAVGD